MSDLKSDLLLESLSLAELQGELSYRMQAAGFQLVCIPVERLAKLEEVERGLGKPKHQRYLQLCTDFEKRVLIAAKTFAQHWRDQDGVNAAVLDALADAVIRWEASEPPEQCACERLGLPAEKRCQRCNKRTPDDAQERT